MGKKWLMFQMWRKNGKTLIKKWGKHLCEEREGDRWVLLMVREWKNCHSILPSLLIDGFCWWLKDEKNSSAIVAFYHHWAVTKHWRHHCCILPSLGSHGTSPSFAIIVLHPHVTSGMIVRISWQDPSGSLDWRDLKFKFETWKPFAPSPLSIL